MHPKLTETLSKYTKIILVGGGTGGHVQPIVSVIQYLREPENPTIQQSNILWIGGAKSQEEQAARENNVEFVTVPTLKLSTTRSPKVLLYPFVLIAGILEARKILRSVIARDEAIQEPGSPHSAIAPFAMTKPIAVFSKGGPGSVAIGIAAWTLRIPLYIHESDTIPGRSNRILGKFATKIFLGFYSAKQYFRAEKCETIGQILHPVFSAQHSNTPTLQHSISWKTDKKHLLVICGSQGARVIFEEILQNLETILEKHEVILVLGKLNTDMRKDFEEKIHTLDERFLHLPAGRQQKGQSHPIEPSDHPTIGLYDWISQADLAYIIPDADIAITRGSATTLAELTAFGQHPTVQRSNNPTLIIIPLPYSADNHQYYNALEYEKMGHTLLEQKNISLLTNTIEKIGQNSQHSNI